MNPQGSSGDQGGAASPAGCIVTAEDPGCAESGAAIARELRLPFVSPLPPGMDAQPLLVQTHRGLELQPSAGRGARLALDFAGGELRHRRFQGANRTSLLARAIGARRAYDAPRVLDATGGLGRDAFILALLGCQVTLLERAAPVWAVLRDALRRAAADADTAPVVARIVLVHADAREYLGENGLPADVVYLDPMFPEEKRSALVKQEMRLLREVVGDDADAHQLFEAAEASGIRRIVVKRMKSAPPLAPAPPSFVVSGRGNRFDVYLR